MGNPSPSTILKILKIKFQSKLKLVTNNFNKFILKFLSMKFKIYSLVLSLTSIFTISINSIFGDSDFILELVNVNKYLQSQI